MSRRRGRISRRLRWWLLAGAVMLVLGACWGLWRAQITSQVGPTWRGLTVGKSTTDEMVAALGSPLQTERRLGYTLYTYQDGPDEWCKHYILTHWGIVVQIRETHICYQKSLLTDILDQYGTPDYVSWSCKAPGFRVAVFLDDGVLVHAVGFPLQSEQHAAWVDSVVYYQPRSLLRVMVDFRGDVSLSNPFEDSDVVGPRDPWFSEAGE